MSIPIKKLLDLNYIVVHANCADGTAAAHILQQCLGYDVPVEFVQHNTDAHKTLEVRPNMVFADFSPHPDRVKDFVDAGAVVLDHHKTAKDIVANFGELGVYGDEILEPGIAGATLAFREVYMPLARHRGVQVAHPSLVYLKDFATLAGIHDTWQRNSSRWREACEQAAALKWWPWEQIGIPMTQDAWKSKMRIGSVLFQKKLDTAKRFGDNSYRFTSKKGTKVAVFSGINMSSDVAEYLNEDVDLVIGFDVFLVDEVPSILISTRSHTTFDCGKFCAAHGGGGHTKAAGFKIVLKPNSPQPFELVRQVLERYEAAD